MTKLVSINKYKKDKKNELLLKKTEKVIEDVHMIIKIIDLATEGLSHYNKYTYAAECISLMQNNKIMLNILLSKYNKNIDKIKEELKNGELEETPKKDTE